MLKEPEGIYPLSTIVRPNALEPSSPHTDEEVWGMFRGTFRPGFVPESFLFVGDTGGLAALAEAEYPDAIILSVDRSPDRCELLRLIAMSPKRKVFEGDISDPEMIRRIRKETSGGADAVLMVRNVSIISQTERQAAIAGIMEACNPGGVAALCVPSIMSGLWELSSDVLEEPTIKSGDHRSTLYVVNKAA